MTRCATTVCFGLIVLVCSLSPICLASVNEANQDAFYLSVGLNDPYNADLLIRTPIKIGTPFRVTVENGNVKTTMSGTVGAPVNQSYQMTLTVTDGHPPSAILQTPPISVWNWTNPLATESYHRSCIREQ